MTSLPSIVSDFIDETDVCVDVFIDGKKSFKLTNIRKVTPRKVCDPSLTGGERKKKLWKNHFLTSYYNNSAICIVTELCVQQYLDNEKLSDKTHTTYDLLEFLWKNLDVEVYFHADGLKYEAKERTLHVLSNASRTMLISEEMVKEPSNKKRRVAPKKSISLINNHIESFLNGDNYLTIVKKTGELLLRVYPAWKELHITETSPEDVRTHAEYKIRISQYCLTERKWGPKSPPRDSYVLTYLSNIAERGDWGYIGNTAVFFSNFFDVKLGDWLIPVSATAITSDNVEGTYAAEQAFRDKLFKTIDHVCNTVVSNLLYPEVRILRCSNIILKDGGYTPLK